MGRRLLTGKNPNVTMESQEEGLEGGLSTQQP